MSRRVGRTSLNSTSKPPTAAILRYREWAGDLERIKQYAKANQDEVFLRCIQSECFSVTVGPDKLKFSVHKDLIVRYSPVFAQMCRLPFKEAERKSIQLPEDDSSTFGNFVSWIYKAMPHPDSHIPSSSLAKLGIFAEKYQILPLTEQICDTMLERLYRGGTPLLAPSDIRAVFEGTPNKSPLRHVCCLFLNHGLQVTENKISRKWEKLFEEIPELGWHCFRIEKSRNARMLSGAEKTSEAPPALAGTSFPYRLPLPVADIDGALKQAMDVDPFFFDLEAWCSLTKKIGKVEREPNDLSVVDDAEAKELYPAVSSK